MKFALGQEVKDIVTGYVGIVAGRTEYLTGCNHYGLAARKLDKDGKPRNWEWFDESRLVSTGKKLANYKAPMTSGPEQNPPQN